MRFPASSRVILVSAFFVAISFGIAAHGSPIVTAPTEGTKAAADPGGAPSLPGMTPWGALITALMMLLGSSYTLYGYGGRTATQEPTVAQAEAEAPAARKPARERIPRPGIPSGRHTEPRQPLQRARIQNRHPHTATSRSKKRRVGAGCRGPLRKT